MNCRNCGMKLEYCVLDLGTSPPANAYLRLEDLNKPERWYPLRLLLCDGCGLVQTEDFLERETLFTPDYAYFSSYSSTWLKHAKKLFEMAKERFELCNKSFVLEVASNDGYLLQYVKSAGIPCLGIEPTLATAEVAQSKGIETIVDFFGFELACKLRSSGIKADLIFAINVLAHVPDINDFVKGFKEILKPQGVVIFEFQYLVPLVKNCFFDTVYHEHYSYLSLKTVAEILEKYGLSVFDVELLSTQGGSLRVYAQREDTGKREVTERVKEMLLEEEKLGVHRREFYAHLQMRAERVKDEALQFLIQAKKEGKRVVGYGAPAKGNTFLNFAGVKRDLLSFVVDANPFKQGKFLPGSRIPIYPPDKLKEAKADYVVILPWNIKEEIIALLTERYALDTFVTFLPTLEVLKMEGEAYKKD